MSRDPKYGEQEVREEVNKLNAYLLSTYKIWNKRFDIRHKQGSVPEYKDHESTGDEILSSMIASVGLNPSNQGGTPNQDPGTEGKTPQRFADPNVWQLYMVNDEASPTLGPEISNYMSAEQLYHTVQAIIAFLKAIMSEI
jgi:hypothetical protein